MNKSVAIATLEYILDWSTDPLSNHLELGFRHGELTCREVVERSKDFSSYVHMVLPEIIDLLKENT